MAEMQGDTLKLTCFECKHRNKALPEMPTIEIQDMGYTSKEIREKLPSYCTHPSQAHVSWYAATDICDCSYGDVEEGVHITYYHYNEDDDEWVEDD